MTTEKQINEFISITAPLVEMLKNNSCNKALNPEQSALMSAFLGKDGDKGVEAVIAYFDVLKWNENFNYGANVDPKLIDMFLDQMTDTLAYCTVMHFFIAREGFNPRLKKIDEHMRNQFHFFARHASRFGITPDKTSYVSRFFDIWVQSQYSLAMISYYNLYKDTLEKCGVTINPQTDYKYLCNDLLNYHLKVERGSETICQEQKEIQDMFVHDAIELLKKGDIDEVWKNDVVNVAFQLYDAHTVPISEEEIANVQYYRNEFLQQPCFTDKSIEDALHTMHDIASKYRKCEIYDSQDVEKFAEAYKLVYLKEYLSGKQRNVSFELAGSLQEEFSRFYSTSYEYARFIIMQAEAMKECGGINSEDIDILKRRAATDLAIKLDTHRLYKYEDGGKSNLVAMPMFHDKYTKTYGGMARTRYSNLIGISDIDTESPLGFQLLGTTAHEIAHLDTSSYQTGSKKMRINSYNKYKEEIASIYFPSINHYNYRSLYDEIHSEIRKLEFLLESIRSFPIDTKKYSETLIVNATRNILGRKYEEALNDKFTIHESGFDGEYYSVKIFDRVMAEHFDEIRSKDLYGVSDVLLFEYREDGTPKTYEEIVQEMRNDSYMDTEDFPKIGPINGNERMALRMRIMMQRALAYDECEKFEKAITPFIEDFFPGVSGNPFFKKIFTQKKMPSFLDSEVKIRNELDSEWPDFERLELLYGFREVGRRILSKEAEQYKEANQKDKFAPNQKSTELPTSDGQYPV